MSQCKIYFSITSFDSVHTSHMYKKNLDGFFFTGRVTFPPSFFIGWYSFVDHRSIFKIVSRHHITYLNATSYVRTYMMYVRKLRHFRGTAAADGQDGAKGKKIDDFRF